MPSGRRAASPRPGVLTGRRCQEREECKNCAKRYMEVYHESWTLEFLLRHRSTQAAVTAEISRRDVCCGEDEDGTDVTF